MNEQTMYEIPVPSDLDTIVAINNGTKWLRGILPGSVVVEYGYITFVCQWGRGIRRFTMATDLVGGYECNA
jgi:hypothetical protein